MRGLMRLSSTERLLAGIMVALAAFIAVKALRTQDAQTTNDAGRNSASAAQHDESSPERVVTLSALAAPAHDPERIARILRSRDAGTYMHELFAAHDSTNFRWPDRRHAPMRIWVQQSDLLGFDAAYPQLVRDAFSAWPDVGVPIHFSFTLDSARAEIHVTWVDRFERPMTGRTRWAHDRHQWIVGGNIQLALHQPDGVQLDHAAVRAIALHEVGHLIGLDHTADEANIMAARVRVSELSEADRMTARLVYALPPGSLKGSVPR